MLTRIRNHHCRSAHGLDDRKLGDRTEQVYFVRVQRVP